MSDLTEQRLRSLWVAGDLSGTAAAALEAYGREVLGFLMATLRDETDASDVFSQTCEDLWRGLGEFQWRATLRTWLYTLARNAAHRHRRSPQNRPSRRVALSRLDEAVDMARSRTLTFLRSEVKDDFARIRDSLEPDERALLILRVDREMAWLDVARVLSDAESPTDAELERDVTRLRKRFQRVKEEIRRRATDAGLLQEN